jgi:hypothetical protein
MNELPCLRIKTGNLGPGVIIAAPIASTACPPSTKVTCAAGVDAVAGASFTENLGAGSAGPSGVATIGSNRRRHDDNLSNMVSEIVYQAGNCLRTNGKIYLHAVS